MLVAALFIAEHERHGSCSPVQPSPAVPFTGSCTPAQKLPPTLKTAPGTTRRFETTTADGNVINAAKRTTPSVCDNSARRSDGIAAKNQGGRGGQPMQNPSTMCDPAPIRNSDSAHGPARSGMDSASGPSVGTVKETRAMSTNDNDFAALGIAPDLATCLADLGYEAPTPIQQRAIPAMIAGYDLLCQAATGTGKRRHLRCRSRIVERTVRVASKVPLPTALVLTPTRELCMQVAEAVHRYGRPYGVRTLPVFGGQPIGRQVAALKRGVDVVVATPVAPWI